MAIKSIKTKCVRYYIKTFTVTFDTEAQITGTVELRANPNFFYTKNKPLGFPYIYRIVYDNNQVRKNKALTKEIKTALTEKLDKRFRWRMDS